jgi:alpha-D-ribose 1-methylphosphonate 5-phosphate C-P lyase
VLDPSPIPRFDVPKLHQSPALILFGAGREKKIYAVPPYTNAEPLVFEDVPFRTEDFSDAQGRRRSCQRCGATDSFLDEFTGNAGERIYQCSDSDYCNQRLSAQHSAADEASR